MLYFRAYAEAVQFNAETGDKQAPSRILQYPIKRELPLNAHLSCIDTNDCVKHWSEDIVEVS